MPIATGQTIASADLDSAFDGYTASLAVEAARKVGATLMQWELPWVQSGLAEGLRTVSYVPPDDLEVIEIGCSSYDENTNSTVTATLTGLLLGTVTFTGTHTTDSLDLTRHYSETSNPPEVLLKGGTYTWVVSSTASSGSHCRITPFILVRTQLRRTP